MMTKDTYTLVLRGISDGYPIGTAISSFSPHACRRHFVRLLASIVTTGCLLPPSALGQLMPDLASPHHPEHLLIRFAADVSDATIDSVNNAFGAVKLKRYRYVPGLYLVKVSPDTLADSITDYLNSPFVVDVEPDYILRLHAVPNDPEFNKQWGLHNTGQFVNDEGGTPNVDARVHKAWDEWTGSNDILIAVIDTGIDYNHPDLFPNIWMNPCEDLNGNGIVDPEEINGIDDACEGEQPNGYVDDFHGYDFSNDDGDPMDDHVLFHGTHVAGIIGAAGNNALGVVGTNWQCQLVALKIIPAGEGGSLVSLACLAMEYVIANNIKVSNNSWGCSDIDLSCPPQADLDALKTEILNARNQIGHIFVAAAGNASLDLDIPGNEHYPANFDLPNIISVAATDNDDNLAFFSNFGANSVDLGAPGVNIYSTQPLGRNQYGFLSGTSMAAPYVAGTAALVWTRFPNMGSDAVTQSDYVIDQILSTVRRIDALCLNTVKQGVLNTWAAVADLDADCQPCCAAPGCPTVCPPECQPDAQQIKLDATLDCNWTPGCNGRGNWILDAYEPDCDTNGEVDSCAIANGSDDCNYDGIPDECGAYPIPDRPLGEEGSTCTSGFDCDDFCVGDTCYVSKNRYISLRIPPSSCDPTVTSVALRVTYFDLPSPFDCHEGESNWIQDPQEISENGGAHEPIPNFDNFWASTLASTRVDRVWHGTCDPVTLKCEGDLNDEEDCLSDDDCAPVIHVFHEGIVPGATYKIQAIAQNADPMDESNYSAPLAVATTDLWGDLIGDCAVTPCTTAEGIINIVDVRAIILKFVNDPAAPIKVRVDLEPGTPDGRINITDVLEGVNAFTGNAYPFCFPEPPGCPSCP